MATATGKRTVKRGNWRVMRYCCNSAGCVGCHERGTAGQLDQRIRIVQVSGVSKETAIVSARAHHMYEATAEKIPGSPPEKSPRMLAIDALDLVTGDGEWPSPAYEEGPQATRASAMQQAIKNLASAVLQLTDEIEVMRGGK